MKSVGQFLRETRESQFYTLEDVEKHTKIRKELIQALEENNYDRLPPATFIQGFIKNYGKFLGLNTEKLLALFRRDYEARKHPPVVMKSFANPIDKKRFRVTPSKVLSVVVMAIILSFFGYLWFEYRQYVGSPQLVVMSPVDQQSVDIPQVMVEGKTDPEVKVAVNNQEIGVDNQGNFKEEVKLSESNNLLVIIATSKFGQTSKVEKTVFVKK